MQANHPVEVKLLQTTNFKPVEGNVDFLEDVHSWKWYWACGKRLMIVGLGVCLCVLPLFHQEYLIVILATITLCSKCLGNFLGLLGLAARNQ